MSANTWEVTGANRQECIDKAVKLSSDFYGEGWTHQARVLSVEPGLAVLYRCEVWVISEPIRTRIPWWQRVNFFR